MVIISAPWVVPVSAPVIRHGAIVVAAGRIVDIGRRTDILNKYPHQNEKKYPCLLLPALVNAHMHLELSHLSCGDSLPPRNFTEWIEALIQRRGQDTATEDEIVAAFSAELAGQYSLGVGLIGDIGNNHHDALHAADGIHRPEVIRMLEFLGPNRSASLQAINNLQQLDKQVAATGHAPYSTAPDLLQEIKKRCVRLSHVFSIHACESRDEREFVQTGSGSFRDFLVKKNSWDGTFPFSQTEFSGTIAYLAHLGLLDDKTLLVHCVHVFEEELLLIKQSGAKICLCPGSNAFLDNGDAPVEQMVALGLLPALGTDSTASNPSLDIWREMQLLAKRHSAVASADILAMATRGGADALAREDDFGCLAVGKKARCIHVSSAPLLNCETGHQLVDTLVANGRPTRIEWIPTVYD